jgi:hypothetical protein
VVSSATVRGRVHHTGHGEKVSSSLELLQLGFKPLPKPALHQLTQLIHQVTFGLPDGARTIALATHQTSSLQLAELTTDVRLRKPCRLNQGGHIRWPLFQITEQLETGRFAQEPEKLAVLLE